ncbi:hypothetical protein SUGI_0197750 [Cryptomeria japonica]|uniref:transcription factor MYB82-like n=1 Tax=Cryptomeria japonica TaxID=3369 RepID=UPI002408C4FD|nr:transcription factor MYB82-like [Cryptomeria japonica]GLJ12787.1 hypothetical protein SUGI_0197750 [Cryptomeria japonica]
MDQERKKERRMRPAKKCPWSREEDLLLLKHVQTYGEGGWSHLPQKAGLVGRSPQSCRFRWKNYLHPDIKHEAISAEEEDLIIRLHRLVGNRWSLIAGRVTGRTNNQIKNFWHNKMRKKHRASANNVQSETSSTHEESLVTHQVDCTPKDNTTIISDGFEFIDNFMENDSLNPMTEEMAFTGVPQIEPSYSELLETMEIFQGNGNSTVNPNHMWTM